VEIEAERGAVVPGPLQRLPARDAETHARRAFQALVGRSDHGIEGYGARIQGNRAESAHRIDQKAAAVPGRHLGHGLERIEDSGGGLAVDHGDVADPGVGGQRGVQRRGIDRRVLGRFLNHRGAAVVVADPGDALAVGAVDQDQDLTVGRHEVAHHGLDHEGPAALERHADMAVAAVHDFDQPFADPAVHGDEVRIARAVVVQHGLLDPGRGGERPGGEQPGIAGRRCGRWGGHGGVPRRRAVDACTAMNRSII
jgi:hypothetical protein